MKKKTMVCVGMDVLPSMAATSRAAIAALEVAWCNRKAAGDIGKPCKYAPLSSPHSVA